MSVRRAAVVRSGEHRHRLRCDAPFWIRGSGSTRSDATWAVWPRRDRTTCRWPRGSRRRQWPPEVSVFHPDGPTVGHGRVRRPETEPATRPPRHDLPHISRPTDGAARTAQEREDPADDLTTTSPSHGSCGPGTRLLEGSAPGPLSCVMHTAEVPNHPTPTIARRPPPFGGAPSSARRFRREAVQPPRTAARRRPHASGR